MSRPIDDSILIEVAHLICGDDMPLLYRKGFEIPNFLRRAGWEDVPDYDGMSRQQWTLELLRERQADGTDEPLRAVLRLANRREYVGQEREYEAVLTRLNAVLALDEQRIGYNEGQPVLLPIESDDEQTPMPRIELRVSIGQIVSDPELAATIQLRLDEARTCYEHGAYTSAVIMLGSLLEGVLVHAAQTRSGSARPRRPFQSMGLKELVDLAHSNQWIEHDAKLASELVRHYRNLVHPLAERRTGHSPNRDTVDMCWPVVNATLNDLAATAPANPPDSPPSSAQTQATCHPTPAVGSQNTPRQPRRT